MKKPEEKKRGILMQSEVNVVKNRGRNEN